MLLEVHVHVCITQNSLNELLLRGILSKHFIHEMLHRLRDDPHNTNIVLTAPATHQLNNRRLFSGGFVLQTLHSLPIDDRSHVISRHCPDSMEPSYWPMCGPLCRGDNYGR